MHVSAKYAALLAKFATESVNFQRTYDAIRHASTVSKICLNVSVPSLILPPSWLPITPMTVDNTKLILEYSALKELLRAKILASALASALCSEGRLMLEVDGRCSTNTKGKGMELEAVGMEMRFKAYTRAWWVKWWISLDMSSWPYDGKGNYIEATRTSADEKVEIEALAYTRETIVTLFEYNMNNIEPSQGQQDAPKRPKNETNTIIFRSAGTTTTPPSFIAMVIGILASIFCFIPLNHSDSDGEMIPQAAPEADMQLQFQHLPFNSEGTQAVWKRPQRSNLRKPTVAETEKPAWSLYKGKDAASHPPVSEWTAITSGHKVIGPAQIPRSVPERKSNPDNRRGIGPKVPQQSEQSDDEADQMWKPIPFDRMGKDLASPSPLPLPDGTADDIEKLSIRRDKGKESAPSSHVFERTSSKKSDAYRLSKTLGKAFNSGRVPAEMMKKRSEELLQEAYALGWGHGIKAERPSSPSPPKEGEGGLWLDWEEERAPILIPSQEHSAPAMSRNLESTTVPAEKPRGESPPEADKIGRAHV